MARWSENYIPNKKHPLYVTWKNMRQRCSNPAATSYKSHGARGISVCDRWSNFEMFVFDMFHGYKKGLSLDRIDNNGNYSPENCRWATRTQQANNRRNQHLVSFDGKSKTLTQWAADLGVNRSTLAQRHYTYKFPIEKVLKELHV